MKWSFGFLLLGLSAACTDGSQGSSSTGTTTGPPAVLVGTCSHTLTSEAFASCSISEPCSCPMECVADPVFGSPVCEQPCADPCPGTMSLPGMSDSSLPTSSACESSYCRLGACAFAPSGAAAPGSYNGLCTVVEPNDGTCFPNGAALADGGLTLWGICLLGNPEGICNANDQTCPAGDFCVAGACRPACDPTVAGSCTDGATCQSFPAASNPHAGYCGPPCGLNGQACGEVCCDILSACTGGSNGICKPGG